MYMKILKPIGLIAAVIFSQDTWAQEAKLVEYKAVLKTINDEALAGAQVRTTAADIYAYSDSDGSFSIQIPDTTSALAIEMDHLNLTRHIHIDAHSKNDTFQLELATELEGFVFTKRRKSTEINMLDPVRSENLGIRELHKAACCNLSESFETTPSIDVGFTDAVSGYRQITLLGLSGPHVLFTRENIPDTRGLANVVGLTFTPGAWVESIQLSKGTGSVVNGYEGVAGQINVELHKPRETDGIKLLLNAYQSDQGRTELNVVSNNFINHDLNTSIFAHAKSNYIKTDQNNDGYLDQPLGNTYILGNRWIYFNDRGWEMQLGVKGVLMDLWGGQNNFEKSQELNSRNPWGFKQDTKRLEGWAKFGKVNVSKPYESMGLQINAFHHDSRANYGMNRYSGKQNSFYANYIFQSIIGNTNHIIKGGASFQYDDFEEEFKQNTFSRQEIVPGAFAEYTYLYETKLSLVAGLRADHSSMYGLFVTPRLHLRYAPIEKLVFRASAGRAQRTANPLSENMGTMASSRQFIFENVHAKNPFGLEQEVAWNFGLNGTWQFMLNYRDGSISADYYFTNFENMAVADLEDYRNIRIYNLDGPAFAHSFQAQFDYELIRNWDWRIAYRYYDVQTSFKHEGLLQKPLLSKNRFFVNTAYETRNKWSFDATANWSGPKRIPQHIDARGDLASSHQTPSFWLFNAQIAKTWQEEKWRVYLGVENIFATMQHHMILGQQHPYDPGFDASLIWGSAHGRNIYFGINYALR